MAVTIPSVHRAPRVPLAALDQLWFQVSGTVCNLSCSHCFISCSPENHAFWFMTRDQVSTALESSRRLGTKEYYFTGGEPFMNPDMLLILEDTLALGPGTVLTNATLLPQRRVNELARIAAGSPYSLEIRVSLDGVSPEMNDALRGEGSFDRAVEGVARLVSAGFLPIITTMQTWEDRETPEILGRFKRLLSEVGYTRPRLKVLPPLRIGAEAERTHGYEPTERVTHEMLHGFDLDLLLCHRARLVTAAGVYACPILLDYPSARLAANLEEAVGIDTPLAESACYTCYVSGAICANVPVSAKEFT